MGARPLRVRHEHTMFRHHFKPLHMPSIPGIYCRRLCSVVATALLLTSPNAGLTAQGSQDAIAIDSSALQRLGEQLVANNRAGGLSVAIVRDDTVRYFNFAGGPSACAQSPNQNTVYEIGSITKVFSSLLLANAVAEGRVELQDDIRKYLTEEYPNLQRDGTPVRLVHLVETTSGLPDNIPDLTSLVQTEGPNRAPRAIVERWQRYGARQLLTDLHHVTLDHTPGVTSRHSNVAATLVGFILEKVFAQPYEKLIQTYIEEPFGMNSGTGSGRGRAAVAGCNAAGVVMPAIDSRYIRSAGGLRYSSADMARFARAQLASTSAALRLSQQATGESAGTGLGFNWRMSPGRDGALVLRASGGTFGSSSYIEVRPDAGYALVLLTNQAGVESMLYDLAVQIRRAVR